MSAQGIVWPDKRRARSQRPRRDAAEAAEQASADEGRDGRGDRDRRDADQFAGAVLAGGAPRREPMTPTASE